MKTFSAEGQSRNRSDTQTGNVKYSIAFTDYYFSVYAVKNRKIKSQHSLLMMTIIKEIFKKVKVESNRSAHYFKNLF
jgi:hypothetical protein